MTKKEIRDKMKGRRAALSHKEREEKSLVAAGALLSTSEYRSADSVMLYCPLGGEADTSYIAEAAMADGKRVIYPVTDGTSGRITPVLVDKNTEFKRGAFGIYEPSGEVYDGEIDIIIVPGVAFDRQGGRLGFGKGCYDAFLDSVGALKVGLCYNIQIIDALPTEPHDVNMDMIVTEREIIYCKRKGAVAFRHNQIKNK